MGPRVVEPEILDSLPADHPEAVASRRDLRLINGLMGNFRWFGRRLADSLRANHRVLEMGAGDGALAHSLRRKIPSLAGRYTALDLAPRPPDWPVDFNWAQADLFSEQGAAELARADVVIANLFLHHFEDDALAWLGTLLGNARLLFFSEPARRERHVWQGRLLAPVARLNRVTRHDLPVSVRAGFRGAELADALNLTRTDQANRSDSPDLTFQTEETLLGAHRLCVMRE